MVVNKINDVFYLDCDTEFTNHINAQAVEQGLLEVSQLPRVGHYRRIHADKLNILIKEN